MRYKISFICKLAHVIQSSRSIKWVPIFEDEAYRGLNDSMYGFDDI